MSASALLSVLTGGALNGASGAPVSDARTDGASDMGAAVAASFSSLIDAESIASETGEAGKAISIDPVIPRANALPRAYSALVQGLPLTLEAASARTESVDVEIFAASAEVATTADVSLTPTTQPQQTETTREETSAGDTYADASSVVVEVPVQIPVQITADPATVTPEALSASGSTASGPTKAADVAQMAAALLAQSASDEAQDAPIQDAPPMDGETVHDKARAETVAQMARQTASAQSAIAATQQSPATQAHATQALATQAQAIQAQARLQDSAHKNASSNRADASESLSAADAESSAQKTAGETPTSGATKLANAQDARTAAPAATADAAIAPLTNETAPQDTEAQTFEPLETQQTEVRTADTSRLSRATAETTAQIAASILRKLEGRTTRFDMVLTPEHLGSVNVSMEIDAEGHMTARLAFDNPAATTEMRARAEELRRQLVEAGFQLSEKSLEFTDRDSNSRGGFQQFQTDERLNRRAFAGGNRLAAEADAPVTPVWTSVTLAPSGVDMKV